MPSRRQGSNANGWTLVEVLVVTGIIGILAAILAGAMVPVRQSARAISCLNNLRQISLALTAYYTDHRAYASPVDGSLTELLSPYLKDAKVFVCPVEGDDADDSYSQYWMPQIPGSPDAFLVGCANHTGTSITPAAFAAGRAESRKTAKITWNGTLIDAGTEVTGGVLRFADATTVTIAGSFPVTAVISFEESQGRTYSGIRVDEGATGALTVQASAGTHFDVATPACTIGVQGTQFQVAVSETIYDYTTQVTVQSGTVLIDSGYPASGETFLAAGRTGTYKRTKKEVVLAGVLAIAGPTFSNKQVTYSLTNVGTASYVVNSATITWPVSNNKKLQSVTMGGTTLWSGTKTTSPLALTFTGANAARTIPAGATVQFTVGFSKKANTKTANYTLVLSQ